MSKSNECVVCTPKDEVYSFPIDNFIYGSWTVKLKLTRPEVLTQTANYYSCNKVVGKFPVFFVLLIGRETRAPMVFTRFDIRFMFLNEFVHFWYSVN